MTNDGTARPDPGPPIGSDAGDQPYVWLTTTGRSSGEPRTVELWFVLQGRTTHFLSGGGARAQWVRNAQVEPAVHVRLGQQVYAGIARVTETGSAEDDDARRRMATKYQGWREGRPMSAWARESLCLAVDLVGTID